MEKLGLIITVFIALMVIIFLCYLFFFKKDIIITTLIPAGSTVEADQYYFLPAASMEMKASATIIITRSKEDNKILDAKLLQISFEPQVKIEADGKNLLGIKYQSDSFSNDELKVITNENSLLQSASVITEDRFVNIIAKVAEAPRQILAEKEIARDFALSDVSPVNPISIITETIQFSRNFTITSGELEKGGFWKEWTVNIDGETEETPKVVSASFWVENINHRTPVWPSAGTKYRALLTRPLTMATMKVYLAKEPREKGAAHPEMPAAGIFSCLLPDTSVLIKTPLRRAFFVKKTVMPKFSNGLLVENYIVKPSEVEAFISIPVNILKAIVSIPAQLLQFKITRNNLETNFEKSLQDLFKAHEQTRQQQITSTKANSAILKDTREQLASIGQKIENIDKGIKYPKALVDQTTFPKLGKLPAKEVKEPPSLTKEILRDLEFNQNDIEIGNGSFEEEKFWDNKFTGNWESYKNESILDCVPASAAHLIICWTSQAKEKTVIPTTQEVIDAYSRACNYSPNTGMNDRGCEIWSFLNQWKSHGIGQDKSRRHARIAAKNRNELKQAIYWFGGCMIGFQMPKTAQQQKQKWEIVPGESEQNTNPGSWGGHAVAAIGYTKTFIRIISWGVPVDVTWEFYEKYNDETFVILSDNWFMNNNLSPSQKDLASLNTAITNLNA